MGVGLNVGVDTGPVIVYTALLSAESAQPDWYAIAWTTVVFNTMNGAEYTAPHPEVPEVGVEPSVVYRIVAPPVVVDNVTGCSLIYDPATGLNVGADTVPVIVYNPTDTTDGVHPSRYAIARIVMDDETGIGVEYTVPDASLGIEPSVE